MSGSEMTMTEHLGELRMRIIRSLLAVGICMIVVLIFYDPIKEFLTQPYIDLCNERQDFECDGSLFALGPLDGFSARVRLSVYIGIAMAAPVILWQIWRFIVPALEKKEKRYALPYILSTLVLFVAGAWLAYWTLDKALEFLVTWSGDDVNQTYQVMSYMNLVILMMLAFGVGFLSPVLIVFAQLVGLVTPRTLVKKWRYAIMLIFVAAAVITPSGDPVSMLALAIPLTFLYVLAVFVGWLLVRNRTTTSV
jgi:sec-independent protein translocase protein TatC